MELVVILRAWLVALCLTSVAALADAQERIALVIGNGGYEFVSTLPNAVPDATLITSALKGAGFDVTTVTDSNLSEMKHAISQFGRKLREAGPDATALFYYAGHAVQSFGNNYLLPVDSAILDQADLDLYGVEASWVVRQLYSARMKTSIVILDACRNNPFEDVAGFESQGLAEMNAPTGSFIAYATAPGMVALDGVGDNSPYTTALVDAINGPPQPIEQMFKSVRVRVLEETRGAQTPWDSSSLTSDFYFRGLQLASPRPEGSASEAEINFWDSVRDSGEASQIELFLRVHPQTSFRAQAEALLASLMLRETEEPEQPSQPAQAEADTGTYTFTTALRSGGPEVEGRTFEQLIVGQPLFPPFEGVPDELWKGQKCTNCHQWTRDLLCEQGQFYLGLDATRSLQKPHPYGGGFKNNLRAWASQGCL